MPDMLTVPQGQFLLSRCPENKKQGLRAWDAADEYLLNEIGELTEADQERQILIVNDSFGGLTIPLAKSCHVHMWSDSFISKQCIEHNLKQNDIDPERYRFIKSTEMPADQYDVILLKVPKNYFYLERQLATIANFASEKTVLLAAAMVKNLHSSTLKIFEKYFAAVSTSLARKKARLVYSKQPRQIKENKFFVHQYVLENTQYTIENLSNVFSREKLDIGTRFFLQNLPQQTDAATIIDLACGNGVVGLIAAESHPRAEIIFTDESYMAVESARRTFLQSGLTNKAEFVVTDGLAGMKAESADLILNNPPFHQQHVVGTQIAVAMFKDAKRVLKPGGELWVVGNRHLGYHLTLKNIFGNCELVARNNRFVIFKTRKIIN